PGLQQNPNCEQRRHKIAESGDQAHNRIKTDTIRGARQHERRIEQLGDVTQCGETPFLSWRERTQPNHSGSHHGKRGCNVGAALVNSTPPNSQTNNKTHAILRLERSLQKNRAYAAPEEVLSRRAPAIWVVGSW